MWSDHFQSVLPELDPNDAWQLRCSMLHQARSATATQPRVLFVGNEVQSSFRDFRINGVVLVDILGFCGRIVATARTWYLANLGTEPVHRNRAALMKWHETGVTPYVQGVPVLS